MNKFRVFIFLSVIMAAITSSCNRDEVLTAYSPEIILEGNGTYEVMVGEELRIAPEYRYAESASFEWLIDGQLVGNDRAYVFRAEAIGEVYITIRVTNNDGSASEEIRIDVVERDVPVVDIAMKDMVVAVGFSKEIVATVRETESEPHIHWYINNNLVAEHTTSYLFEAEATGIYIIRVSAENEWGKSEDSVTLTVVDASELDFVYEFARKEYHIVAGRNLLIGPSVLGGTSNATYEWWVDGESVDDNKAYYVFNSADEGCHTLKVVGTVVINDTPTVITHNFTVEVIAEGKYRRERDGSSMHIFRSVVEYTPAPGQFIGDVKTGGFSEEGFTAEEAATYAEERMRTDNWVSLGAFGGYLIVDFDHSITNNNGYDFAILGNSFDGSSEPGIVWVMQDENGNGLADDNWYELRGSETGARNTYQNYEVTYYRPTGAKMPVYWEDNHGGSGTVDYLSSFHTQPYYYPSWISEDSYTLTGTRLEARNYDSSGNGSMWINPAYDWGYADNFSAIDCTEKANSFDIDNAMDALGNPTKLEFVDFVKVQCAVQAKSGWIGELSTEVCNIYELIE